MTPYHFVLFCDFDGVLHRGTTGTFRHADALANAIAPYPNVKIVISSSWRLCEDLDSLKGYLPVALASRVIAATPDIPGRNRQHEIEAWLAQHPTKHWLALDDERTLYRVGCPWLLATDGREGLTAEDLQILNSKVHAASK